MELYLVKNKISDEGAASLADALKHTTSLMELYLHHNRISDSGAEALA